MLKTCGKIHKGQGLPKTHCLSAKRLIGTLSPWATSSSCTKIALAWFTYLALSKNYQLVGIGPHPEVIIPDQTIQLLGHPGINLNGWFGFGSDANFDYNVCWLMQHENIYKCLKCGGKWFGPGYKMYRFMCVFCWLWKWKINFKAIKRLK